jgi:hypothetical protein
MSSEFLKLGVQTFSDISQTPPDPLTRSQSELQRQVQTVSAEDRSGLTTKNAASACELPESAVILRTTNKIIRTTRTGVRVGSRPKLSSPITVTHHSNSFSNTMPKNYSPRSPGAPTRIINKIKRTTIVFPDEAPRSPKRTAIVIPDEAPQSPKRTLQTRSFLRAPTPES